MRVFVAGATGAIGRPLLEQLREAGHEVVGTTRSPEKAVRISELGAAPVVLDARDTDALRGAVIEAQSDVVVNQLTALPDRLNYRNLEETFGATNELRGRVGPALAGAAAEAGAGRLIAQSICFYYASTGKRVHEEDDPLMQLPPETPGGRGMIAMEALERSTVETPGLEGVVLRYGFFYGPGTAYASDGSRAEDARRRRLPVVGKGTGVFSFVHMDDAAAATVAALDRGSGIYNVCDDDPATMAEWVPVYAEAIGAKPPRHIPLWLARLVGGKQAAVMAERLEGASNEKAKRELGWQPRYPSWRQGFQQGLG
ncbi:MAG TPA: NAD(P)-dependent oxidoreductase [Solirubrobacterales bacterium]|nr:NAD(P)-dependent oxidoreductase [Solirubrobacterales bacterium]